LIAIVVGTHGNLSKELLKASEMIIGQQHNVEAVTFQLGESIEDLTLRYEETLSNLDTSEGVLFIVDLFGGSPYNAASLVAIKQEKMDIITGVNLPMLIKAFVSRKTSSLEEVIKASELSGREGIKQFKENFSLVEEEEL